MRLGAQLSAWILAPLMVAATASALPFNDDMVGGQDITGTIMRPKAPNTVPLGMRERQVPQGLEPLPVSNPLPSNPDVLARGKRLFTVNCTPCHGTFGPGGVHQFSQLMLKGIPSINLADSTVAAKPDGHFFGYVHRGGVLMPPYGWKLWDTEMWQIITYVRAVQAEAKSATAQQ